VIEEFEKGLRSDVQLNENTQGGKVSFTAEVQVETQTTSTKRQKIDRWISPSSAGYVAVTDDNIICVINNSVITNIQSSSSVSR
jgi:hypothetical protein